MRTTSLSRGTAAGSVRRFRQRRRPAAGRSRCSRWTTARATRATAASRTTDRSGDLALQRDLAPPPRREYTKRDDYDVLLGANVHRITPEGWYHEQEEREARAVAAPLAGAREGDEPLRQDRLDRHGAGARSTGSRREAFWKQVWDEWARVIAAHPRLFLRTEVDGKRLYEPLFERAKASRSRRSKPRRRTSSATRSRATSRTRPKLGRR